MVLRLVLHQYLWCWNSGNAKEEINRIIVNTSRTIMNYSLTLTRMRYWTTCSDWQFIHHIAKEGCPKNSTSWYDIRCLDNTSVKRGLWSRTSQQNIKWQSHLISFFVQLPYIYIHLPVHQSVLSLHICLTRSPCNCLSGGSFSHSLLISVFLTFLWYLHSAWLRISMPAFSV